MTEFKPSKTPLIFTLANRKGGVLKTTNCVNLAYAYTQMGFKVLVIDNDPQGSMTQILGIERKIGNSPELNIDNIAEISKEIQERGNAPYVIDDLFGNPTERETAESEYSGLYDLYAMAFMNEEITKKDIDEAIITPTFKMEMKRKKNETVEMGELPKRYKRYTFGFDLLPSSEELTDAELSITLSNDTKSNKKGYLLEEIIERIQWFRDYDIILIDNGPSLGLFSLNALLAAKDGVIISTSVDEQSLWSLEKFKLNIRQTKNFSKDHEGVLGVILAPCDNRSQLHPIIGYKITEVLKLFLFKTKIPRSVNAAKATSSGLLFSQIDNRANDAYKQLAIEILERREQNHKWHVNLWKMINKEIKEMKKDPRYAEWSEEKLIQRIRNKQDNFELWQAPMSDYSEGSDE